MQAPWAKQDRPLEEKDLVDRAGERLLERIACTAIAGGFQAVLAPARFLERWPNSTFAVDYGNCERLRHVLDKAGGTHIAIDYPLIITAATLRDPAQRETIIEAMTGLPIENIWLRVSNFGADASPAGTQRYIEAVADFQSLKKPLIADHVAGLAGLAALAFGVAGGLVHGLGQRERFDATGWRKPPVPTKRGLGKRVYFPGLDRSLTCAQARVLMDAQGGRRILRCNDRSCCPQGFDDPLRYPGAHYLYQRSQQVAQLSDVPQERRVSHFLERQLALTDQITGQASKLRVSDPSVGKMLHKASERAHRMRLVLENMASGFGLTRRCQAPRVRMPPEMKQQRKAG